MKHTTIGWMLVHEWTHLNHWLVEMIPPKKNSTEKLNIVRFDENSSHRFRMTINEQIVPFHGPSGFYRWVFPADDASTIICHIQRIDSFENGPFSIGCDACRQFFSPKPHTPHLFRSSQHFSLFSLFLFCFQLCFVQCPKNARNTWNWRKD